jgi:hypothetical protein
MNHIEIKLGDDFDLHSDLSSPIWVEIDGEAFPDTDWDDFSHILLGWWSSALFSFSHASEGFEWLFMDGPYEIVVRRKGDALALSCMRDDHCLLSGECSFQDLANALYNALKRMGYLLHEKGLDQGATAWMAEDIRVRTDRLRTLL